MKTVVVLGMHRSATSLVARALASEIHMGEDLDTLEMDSQPRGHWEHRRFVALNDAILAAAGGTWRRPPPESAIVAVGADLASHIAEAVAVSAREPIWGWKDPRTTLTVRAYLPHLVNPHFVACVRDPEDVASSLARRDAQFGMTVPEALALAQEYNRRMLRFLVEFSGVS